MKIRFIVDRIKGNAPTFAREILDDLNVLELLIKNAQ
jgi:hypothetical protein